MVLQPEGSGPHTPGGRETRVQTRAQTHIHRQSREELLATGLVLTAPHINTNERKVLEAEDETR